MNQKHLATGSGATAIAYTLHGAGAEYVIVMHDWNGDHTTYDAMIPYLDGAAFTYAFVDLRGYGRSREVSGEYTCAEIAGDCLEIGYLTMFSRTHFADEVRGQQRPYLIVVADNDPGIDEAAMKRTFLAWHPNAELVLISNCGHYPMQECPPYLATVIEPRKRTFKRE
jgi:pimeloyl-ACP methyl ester carboxylesterase